MTLTPSESLLNLCSDYGDGVMTAMTQRQVQGCRLCFSTMSITID
jgi:hypothetical protein